MQIKKRFPDFMARQALLTLEIISILMVMSAIPLGCVDGGFDNTVCHTKAHDAECIPQPSHENHMIQIPDPFKIKWKHN
jgi:hypothetical protein